MGVSTNTGRTMVAIAAVASSIGLAFATPSLGQKVEQDACDRANTQAEINTCTRRSYDVADAELNRDYRQLRTALSQKQKQALLEAQRAWLKFRDSQCIFERSYYAGGTLATAAYSECLGETTRQRSKQLRVHLDNLRR